MEDCLRFATSCGGVVLGPRQRNKYIKKRKHEEIKNRMPKREMFHGSSCSPPDEMNQ